MTTSTAQPGFHEAEIRETLHSLVGILEDADFSKRAYAYTEDATFVMFGAAPVHGREEMLRRLETGTVLSSIKITPHTIEGDGRLAYVYGDFALLSDGAAQGGRRSVENCAGNSLSSGSAKRCEQQRLTLRSTGRPIHDFYMANVPAARRLP